MGVCVFIKILTAGGTIDKVYFDAKSDYQVGPPNIKTVLDDLNLGFEYAIESVLKKDSLDLTREDRECIHRAVARQSADRVIITHGTDTMVETAGQLADIKNKVIVLTGALEPALFKTSDAVFNIGCAVTAVQTLSPGVYIVMNGRVFSHDSVRKNVSKSLFEERSPQNSSLKLMFHPLTIDRWNDFETLFGKNGALGGCWCMWWRITRAEFEKQKGEGNRKAMQAIVASGEAPGILAYEDDTPVGWCSVANRDVFASLNRSPVLKKIDDQKVWSIVCFFVARDHRGMGVTRQLIRAAVSYAAKNGARIVEAYPTNPRGRKQLGAASSFMGLPQLFKAEGFKVCAHPSKAKTIMRYRIGCKKT